jgi:hypothetical protein
MFSNIQIDSVSVFRVCLVYLHILAMIIAFIGIAFGDFAIFWEQKINVKIFKKSAQIVLLSLLALWLSGFLIIFIDNNFSVIMSKPKLLAKLTVVTMLTINGVLLHRYAFPLLLGEKKYSLSKSGLICSLLGAVSLTTWLFSIFVGIGGLLTSFLGFSGFMILYFLAITIAITVSCYTMQAKLQSKLADI